MTSSSPIMVYQALCRLVAGRSSSEPVLQEDITGRLMCVIIGDVRDGKYCLIEYVRCIIMVGGKVWLTGERTLYYGVGGSREHLAVNSNRSLSFILMKKGGLTKGKGEVTSLRPIRSRERERETFHSFLQYLTSVYSPFFC